MNEATLIIPAAGSGSRLNKDIPKPYIRVAGRSILEHTMRRFLGLDILHQIVVATSSAYISETQKILENVIPARLTFKVVEGGEERQHSIYNALSIASDSDLIIIHDAVRPFVKLAHIKSCCKAAVEVGASVLGVPAKDTIKQLDDDNLIRRTPSRKYLWQAQTPQIFKTDVIKEAYKKAFEESFVGTDDASLVERLGYSVKMVEGDRSNFKITYPLDLKLAQLLLGNNDNG